MSAGQSLAEGAAGIALLHLETGNWPAAREALQQATAGGVSIAGGASLFYGAPALAFVLAAADHPGLARAKALTAEGTATVTRNRLDAAHRRIDRGALPHFAEYDLIRGLTGVGVALRQLADHELLRDVLEYLVRLTEPQGDLPGWWCWNSPDRDQPPPVGGHANHGMAHGITGPLALLALTLRDGITVNGQNEAIRRICQWLDTWQQNTDGAIWWPQTLTLTDLDRGAPTQQTPLRPSWCYGTPGIARAQQLAARALHDLDRQHSAEAAFVRCVTDPDQTGRLGERGLCHGTAGLVATARRIAVDALTPTPLDAVAASHRQSSDGFGEAEGLLTGGTGAVLATLGTTATSWDACLLIA
ncbi:hypothetical protein GCM10010123_20190 [Pilimelia anulata]|uniref:Lanthionine synthetase n=1 Tax=Pilimelia anulata TaxID=53371 RepID=A0A8J3B2R2_9ACTN|nr:lanthionine synthetase C family protein [Pilimelia anulata]GGJ90323.1 hypothetical protein GCM10010123_20190 [Pilimelia anulata]